MSKFDFDLCCCVYQSFKYVSGVMCLPVPAATPSIQSTEPEHQNSVANNNNDAVQPRQLGKSPFFYYQVSLFYVSFDLFGILQLKLLLFLV